MNRKINLGKYGHDYESVDIGVEGCESKEEATKEIADWKGVIVDILEGKPKPQPSPFPDDKVILTEEQTNNLKH